MLKVAIVDSGINPQHPHVGPVTGGESFIDSDDSVTPAWLDRLGHGTAIAGVIRERVPEADLFAVKVFDRSFSTSIDRVVRGLEWCLDNEIDVVNLSVATTRAAHADALRDISRRFRCLVAPCEFMGLPAYPGSFHWVYGVTADPACPRGESRILSEAERRFCASPLPRSLEGLPAELNFSGASFAVANFTALLCRQLLDASVNSGRLPAGY